MGLGGWGEVYFEAGSAPAKPDRSIGSGPHGPAAEVFPRKASLPHLSDRVLADGSARGALRPRSVGASTP